MVFRLIITQVACLCTSHITIKPSTAIVILHFSKLGSLLSDPTMNTPYTCTNTSFNCIT